MGILNTLENAATSAVGAVVEGAKDMLGFDEETRTEDIQETDETLSADNFVSDSNDMAMAATDGLPTPSVQTYIVQPGDSLSKISKQFYGTTADYMQIFETNRDQLSDPDDIQIGQELIIPNN